MNYFIVGDIHGCYYTLREMLDNHWHSAEEKLVILGDFVNKGKHTFAVLEFLINLKEKLGEKMVILKGNNEYLFEEYYRDSITLSAKQKFENYNLDYIQTLNWMNKLPHQWQNGVVYASHAGVAEDADFPVEDDNVQILFNRKPLKNIGKLQFVGHVVMDEPKFDENSDAWYLDTGAGFGKKLTAARVENTGVVNEIISVKVNEKDIAN
ncbi:metallophosphoesterase [Moheibacter sediminis]|uniref:Serine/threonine protein phosphatase 1 n=1 Tax=Moheibacter sediminis TaxID=1434700 RepID=A0A1W1Z3V9_9FLAO|nr:metallophosphoesterase [Moheibacter sediminis]SMC42791.1 serine/threonine protein phosphatase 1 [Moheibacter sediminis]